MNTRGVNALAGVIQAAMQTRQTAAGIAMAVEAAGMYQSPETAAELATLRARAVPLPDARLAEIRSLIGDAQPAHPDLLKSIAEGYRDRREHEHPKGNEDWFCTNLACWMGDRMPVVLSRLLDAEARVAELEQQLAARAFYLADVEGVEDGQSLHATADAAKAWVEEVGGPDGDWFERDGVWEQWHTDIDTDRPTGRGAGSVLPLAVQGDGVLAEAERIRRGFLEKSRKLADLLEHRADEREEIRRLHTEQGEIMQALGCGRHDEWDDVVHRARQLAGGAVSS